MRFFIYIAMIATFSLSAQQASPVRVSSVVEKEVMEQQAVTGSVRAALSSDIASLEAGRLESLNVMEGEKVTKGEVLAQLDDRRIKQSILAKKAEIAENKAMLKRYENELVILQQEFDSLIEAEAEYAGSVSKQEKRKSRLQLVTSEGLHAIELARSETLKTELESLNISLSDTKIKAPFTGVVVKKYADQGSWLGAGSKLLKLRSVEDLEAWLTVPESVDTQDLNLKNMSLKVAGKKVELEALRFIPEVDLRSRNYQLVLKLKAQVGLVHGMSIEAMIPKGKKAKHKIVPSDAISRNGAGYYVYVAMPGQQGMSAMPMNVEVLFRQGLNSIVKNPGLQVGASVIIEGNERLFPMMPIQVIQEK